MNKTEVIEILKKATHKKYLEIQEYWRIVGENGCRPDALYEEKEAFEKAVKLLENKDESK